jgi:hypothetical protein
MKASSCRLLAVIVVALCVAPVSLAQVDKDGNDARFYDDLLDHFVGKWDVSATVYGQKFSLDREVEWVLSHQYLRIHEKSREDIPWLKVPFERTIFIGYNHGSKRYVVYELSVHGADGPQEPEGLYYATRTGNELKMAVITKGSEVVSNARFVWEPASGSWQFQARQVIAGKEQAPYLSQKAVPATPSPK